MGRGKGACDHWPVVFKSYLLVEDFILEPAVVSRVHHTCPRARASSGVVHAQGHEDFLWGCRLGNRSAPASYSGVGEEEEVSYRGFLLPFDQRSVTCQSCDLQFVFVSFLVFCFFRGFQMHPSSAVPGERSSESACTELCTRTWSFTKPCSFRAVFFWNKVAVPKLVNEMNACATAVTEKPHP